MTKPNVIFLLSVDTEEEWDWSGPFPDKEFSVKNVNELPAFQTFCQECGIKPTYLVDHAVANNEKSSSILKAFNKNDCEIGAHLHPWANPPFKELTNEFSSHVINLDIDHVEDKLIELLAAIKKNIGCSPKSFRTGRWGIDGDVMKLLEKYEIDADTSIYPLYKNEFFSCESAPASPYWPDYTDTNREGNQRKILELPVTVGFNRSHYPFSQRMHKLLALKPFSTLRLNGIFWHTRILRKLYLSPELCSGNEMKSLIDTSLKKGQHVFHMYLHSSSLLENVTGLSDKINAREYICQQINVALTYLSSKANVTFCTMSEARDTLVSNHEIVTKND